MTTFDPFTQSDDLGPARVIHITERRTELKAMVVIDNLAMGPAAGGLRMAPDMSTDVCLRLARAMTLKNALAGLRHGGAKSGIVADPKMPIDEKQALVRAFASSIRDLADYIPGPDMGTDETCMAWILDETGRAMGLPAVLGGLPLDELGATGFGLAGAAEVVAERIGLDLDGARVVIQGYGAVGRHAAHFLEEKGAVVIATADSRGGVVDRAGLDLGVLDASKKGGGSVTAHPGDHIDRDAVIGVECDILVPAAGPDAITADNVGTVSTKMILQGANIPATEEAEARLHERDIVCMPDFVVNAGGVICAAVEYARGTEGQAFDLIAERVRANTAEVFDRSRDSGETPRQAAMAIARGRVLQAMGTRRWC